VSSRSVVSIAPITATQFALEHELRSLFGTREISDLQRIPIAAVAGFMSAFVSTPPDLLIVQQQRRKTSLKTIYRNAIQTKGLRGLYTGFTGCAMRESIYASAIFGVTPLLKKTFSEANLSFSQGSSSLLASTFAGIAAAVLSHPFDTIKTCQQGDLNEPKKYQRFLQTAQQIYREEGSSFRVFFRGLTPRTFRMIGSVFIVSECSAKLKPYFVEG
jgi:hypothetical protein